MNQGLTRIALLLRGKDSELPRSGPCLPCSLLCPQHLFIWPHNAFRELLPKLVWFPAQSLSLPHSSCRSSSLSLTIPPSYNLHFMCNSRFPILIHSLFCFCYFLPFHSKTSFQSCLHLLSSFPFFTFSLQHIPVELLPLQFLQLLLPKISSNFHVPKSSLNPHFNLSPALLAFNASYVFSFLLMYNL